MSGNVGLRTFAPNVLALQKVLVQEVRLNSNASIEFFNIPQDGEHLELTVTTQAPDGTADTNYVRWYFNGDQTAANYRYGLQYGGTGSTGGQGASDSIIGRTITGMPQTINVLVPFYSRADAYKSALASYQMNYVGGGTYYYYAEVAALYWLSLVPINRITLVSTQSPYTFKVGSRAQLYVCKLANVVL